jgi:putative membrane protein
MDFIIHLLINAAIVFIVAYIMPSVHVKSFGTAIWVALLLGILNATVGLLLRLPLNILTLGLLSFFIRLIVTAVIIKLVDKLVKKFEVQGFWPALVIALALAIGGTLLDNMLLN